MLCHWAAREDGLQTHLSPCPGYAGPCDRLCLQVQPRASPGFCSGGSHVQNTRGASVPIAGSPVGPRVKSVVHVGSSCWISTASMLLRPPMLECAGRLHLSCFHAGMLEPPSAHLPFHCYAEHMERPAGRRCGCWLQDHVIHILGRPCVTSGSVQSLIPAVSAQARGSWDRVCVCVKQKTWVGVRNGSEGK